MPSRGNAAGRHGNALVTSMLTRRCAACEHATLSAGPLRGPRGTVPFSRTSPRKSGQSLGAWHAV